MKILGIDLGTTNSAVAVMQDGRAQILPNREGDYITPSVVFFEGDQPVVGAAAKHSAVLDPNNVVARVKRQMGNATWRAITDSGEYRAEEISGLILKRLKEDAQAACDGETFGSAVITVPAYFQDAERKATMDAGSIAGLTVPAIINEPTAAALAYGIGKGREERVVVYDLGGGTFDVTVLHVTPDEITALATLGIRELGGADWDDELMKWLNEEFKKAVGADLFDDLQAEQDLRDRAEATKVSLSQLSQTRVALSAAGRHQSITITRDIFESITRGLLEQTRGVLEDAIEDAGLHWEEIDKVLLVGGSTKMPAVSKLVQEVTGKKPSRELHPDQVVALGAAIKGAGIAEEEDRRRSSRGPTGIKAAAPTGIREVPVLNDITAHSLGYVLLDKTMEPYNEIVVERGSKLPCTVEGNVHTVADGSTGWLVKVTQGEERELAHVTLVGDGFVNYDTAKPAGYPIRTKFSYDENGLIHIQVFDGMTGGYFGEVRLTRTSNLSDDEVAAAKARLDSVAPD
jgi:molecular chaperone DnaK